MTQDTIQDKSFWREKLLEAANGNRDDRMVRLLESDIVWNAAWKHLVFLDGAKTCIATRETPDGRKRMQRAARDAKVSFLIILQIVALLIQVWLALQKEKKNDNT